MLILNTEYFMNHEEKVQPNSESQRARRDYEPFSSKDFELFILSRASKVLMPIHRILFHPIENC